MCYEERNNNIVKSDELEAIDNDNLESIDNNQDEELEPIDDASDELEAIDSNNELEAIE